MPLCRFPVPHPRVSRVAAELGSGEQYGLSAFIKHLGKSTAVSGGCVCSVKYLIYQALRVVLCFAQAPGLMELPALSPSLSCLSVLCGAQCPQPRLSWWSHTVQQGTGTPGTPRGTAVGPWPRPPHGPGEEPRGALWEWWPRHLPPASFVLLHHRAFLLQCLYSEETGKGEKREKGKEKYQ